LFFQANIFRGQASSKLLMKCVCIFWLITKLITYALWTTYRLFPTVPVNDILYNVPPVIHLILFVASLLCLSLFIINSNKRVAIILFFLEIGTCLLDQNRWQPEIYLFIFFLFCYITVNDEEKLLLCWQIIIVSSYFFSGWFKWHPLFISNVWQKNILSKTFHFQTENRWLLRAGYLIPLYEMLVGVGLCFSLSKRVSVFLVLILHIFNLMWLGPFGLHSNIAVWPFNILMAILVLNLFWNREMIFQNFKKPSLILIIVIMFWGVIPWSNKLGYWDDFLSSEYYGGHGLYCYIDIAKEKVPKALSPYFIKSSLAQNPDSSLLSVQNWSYGELNVPSYPSARFYKKMAEQWFKTYDTTGKIFIVQSLKKTEIRYIPR
jgi:hypothetical protein